MVIIACFTFQHHFYFQEKYFWVASSSRGVGGALGTPVSSNVPGITPGKLRLIS